MARTKTTARLPPTRSHKGKRRRTSPSPERPIRNLFRDPKRQERYEQIKHWYFITERKVVLLPEEYDPFLNGLLRRNWMRLADPLPKFDLEIVREFYANAYPLDGLGEKRSKVRGRWVTYDRASISEFLGHPLPLAEGQLCDYTRRRRSQEAFDEEEVVNLIFISNRSYRLGSSGDPRRILRTDMKTLAQVFMTFLLSNIVPIGHVSDLNVPRCHLLFNIMREDLTVDVAIIIFEEIHKFVRYEVNKNNEKRKCALGFPTLITALCQAQGVEVDLSVKIRPTITKRFIEKFCTNPAEIMPQLEQPVAAEQTPCPEQQPQLNIHHELLEQMRYLRLQMEHTCQQNISIHRGQLHLHEYLYNNVRGPYPGMTPQEFLAYLQWPGDSPIFFRGRKTNWAWQHFCSWIHTR
ncbi:hypothetical protein LR48_Vigan01g101100 [Vigna angularis]|uniref:Putative plant transposon protein domain-containing protein n=1 Tax=Phaseolus angularis TaxID=3914 RepID=A0A0L9TLX8_PHAAN|nr:hypothetical protein LR48_Vigan01g101100 [Vigna angularis]